MRPNLPPSKECRFHSFVNGRRTLARRHLGCHTLLRLHTPRCAQTPAPGTPPSPRSSGHPAAGAPRRIARGSRSSRRQQAPAARRSPRARRPRASPPSVLTKIYTLPFKAATKASADHAIPLCEVSPHQSRRTTALNFQMARGIHAQGNASAAQDLCA